MWLCVSAMGTHCNPTITESQPWVQRDRNDYSVPKPHLGQGYPSLDQAAQGPSSLALKASRDGAFTAFSSADYGENYVT